MMRVVVSHDFYPHVISKMHYQCKSTLTVLCQCSLLYILPRCTRKVSVCRSVRLSVRPSVCQTRGLWQNRRKFCQDFYTI